MGSAAYIGTELELFAEARNWKSYLKRHFEPFIRGDVLEVGAGIGSTTAVLANSAARSWLCLDPDAGLVAQAGQNLKRGVLADIYRIQVGTIDDIDPNETFDTILYIDVLEHIQDDQGEFAKAAQRLRNAGHLLVLCPAHQSLFCEFDAAIGHYRRYNKSMFRQLTAKDLQLVSLNYLDSVGLLASLANRTFLRQRSPSKRQIVVWDRIMVPLSKRLDGLIGNHIGKSIAGVWRKTGDGPAVT